MNTLTNQVVKHVEHYCYSQANAKTSAEIAEDIREPQDAVSSTLSHLFHRNVLERVRSSNSHDNTRHAYYSDPHMPLDEIFEQALKTATPLHAVEVYKVMAMTNMSLACSLMSSVRLEMAISENSLEGAKRDFELVGKLVEETAVYVDIIARLERMSENSVLSKV